MNKAKVVMGKAFAAAMMAAVVSNALADGLPLKDGRYPGPVLIFKLTPDQKKVIDHYRTCQVEQFRTMNEYTPYVFKLTSAQAKELKRMKGFSPKLFTIFETYRGFNDAGPHWNLVLRFSPDEIEVPLDLVVSNADAKANHEMQGWELSNPCFPKLTQP